MTITALDVVLYYIQCSDNHEFHGPKVKFIEHKFHSAIYGVTWTKIGKLPLRILSSYTSTFRAFGVPMTFCSLRAT